MHCHVFPHCIVCKVFCMRVLIFNNSTSLVWPSLFVDWSTCLYTSGCHSSKCWILGCQGSRERTMVVWWMLSFCRSVPHNKYYYRLLCSAVPDNKNYFRLLCSAVPDKNNYFRLSPPWVTTAFLPTSSWQWECCCSVCSTGDRLPPAK